MAAFTFPRSPSAAAAFARVGGGPAPAKTPQEAAAQAAETSLLTGIAGDIGNLNALAAQNEANATAAATEAAGYQRQIEAYGTVGAIAEQNATIEGIAGNIRQLQAGRAVQRTVGRQRAETAAAGFADAGSSLDILKSTLQEGYLQDQLIRSQTSIAQGGFLEQSAAADADAAGAQIASDAAMALSSSYASAGQLATSNAAAMTSALSEYIRSGTGSLSPAARLITSGLGGDFASQFSSAGYGWEPPDWRLGDASRGPNPQASIYGTAGVGGGATTINPISGF